MSKWIFRAKASQQTFFRMWESKSININLLHLAKRSYSSNSEISSLPSNNSISSCLYNRNPRNLERLRIAYKPSGYALDNKPINYWHRLVISQTNRHIKAHIEHYQGNTVVSASTEEWAVKQFLKSTTDKNAAAAIGRVLAQRCLECGLLDVQSFYNREEASSKISLILNEVEGAGISLTEPERYLPHRHWSREAKQNPTQVYEDSQAR